MEFDASQADITGINYASFNQDNTCFALATKRGYAVYSITPYDRKFINDQCGRSIVEMFFKTPIIGLVGTGEDFSSSQRKLELWSVVEGRALCPFNFVTSVLAVRFSKQIMAVILETKIHLFSNPDFKPIGEPLETESNPKGVCALSSENGILAFPAEEPGRVNVYDCANRCFLKTKLEAHNSAISALGLNASGDLLATASETGTVIRIFNLGSDDTKTQELRRGTSYAKVFSLSFSADSKFIVVSSDKPTVHIFKVNLQPRVIQEENTGWGSYLYIPTMVTRVWEPERNFASATNPDKIGKSLAALSGDNKTLFVITESGRFLTFKIPESGGECTLVDNYCIKHPAPNSSVFN